MPLFCLLGVIWLAVIFWNLNQSISFWSYLRNAGDGLQGAKAIVEKCLEHHGSDFAV